MKRETEEFRAIMDLLPQMDVLELMEARESQACQAAEVPQETSDPEEAKDNKVMRDLMDDQALTDFLDKMDRRETKEALVDLDLLEILEWEDLAFKDQRESLDLVVDQEAPGHQAQRECLEIEDSQEIRAAKDCVDSQVLMVLTDL